MRSYLILTPPGGPGEDHRDTLVLRDGFSWLTLLVPWVWLLWNRLWLAAAGAFLLQGLAGFLMRTPGLEIAGALLAFAISLLVALEGRNYRCEALIRRGWTLDSVVSAPNLDTAEEIYFSGLPEQEAQPLPASPEWPKRAKTSGSGWQGPYMGLFEHGGR